MGCRFGWEATRDGIVVEGAGDSLDEGCDGNTEGVGEIEVFEGEGDKEGAGERGGEGRTGLDAM